MDTKHLLDKAWVLIDQHLTQLRIDSTTPDEKGKLKSLTQYDSQVIDRYTKLLLAANKTTGETDEVSGLTDDQLEAEYKDGQDDVQVETGET